MNKIHNIHAEEYYNLYINANAVKQCDICGNSLHFISVISGYTKHCSHRCHALNMAKQGKIHGKIKSLQDSEISKRYVAGESANAIAKSYGENTSIIIRHLKRNGIPIRSRFVDCKFFDEWSPEMAYVFGYWFADGYMSSSRYRIGIASKDLDHLKMIKYIIGPEGRIRKRNISEIIIDSKYAWKSLEKLGGIPRKSKNAKMPNIPKEYLNHFIRGLFDGDGTVVLSKTNYPQVGFASGTRSFLDELNHILPIEGNVIVESCHNKIYHKIKGFSCSLYFYGKRAQEIIKFMYDKSSIHLERKYTRCQKALQWDGKNIGPKLHWNDEDITSLLYLRDIETPYKDISLLLNEYHNPSAICTKYCEMNNE